MEQIGFTYNIKARITSDIPIEKWMKILEIILEEAAKKTLGNAIHNYFSVKAENREKPRKISFPQSNLSGVISTHNCFWNHI